MKMKYIDRKKLGIEMLFAAMSPITSQANELDAAETVSRLCDQPYNTRRRVAAMINSGIKTLTRDKSIDVSAYLNDDILELAKYPATADTMGRLLPFFKWLMEIQRQNALETEKSRYMLNDAVAGMPRDAADFMRTYSESMGQSVTLTRCGNDIVMHTQERFWGSASLVFPDAVTKFSGTLPIVGFAFWLEGEQNNGHYTFSFLLDVEFGNTDSNRRYLQDRNWLKFAFECSRPYMEVNSLDYGKMLADFGRCGHDFIDKWCDEIIMKERMIGEYSLSAKEKELLPIAGVFKLSYRIANPLECVSPASDSRLSEKVLETLENRYRFSQFEELLKSTGEDKLYELLNDAMTLWSSSDFEATSKKLHEFSGLLRQKEQEDSVRSLYKKIIGLMRDCTSEFDGVSLFYRTYPEAADKMCQIIEPKLKSLGFDGEFPHYRRRRGKKGEYITVLTVDESKHPVNGAMRYRFELSAAVEKLSCKNKTSYFAGGVPFEETTAEDCRFVSPKKAKYSELGGDFDGVVALISTDLFDGISDDEVNIDTADVLNKMAEVASKSMCGKKSPRWYRKMRRKSTVKPRWEMTMQEAILKCMPVGLYITMLLTLAYFLCDNFWSVKDYFPQLTSGVAIILALCIGMLVTLICAFVKLRSVKSRIWRY